MTMTSEWVSVGHPDKTCDMIASCLLDRYLERDPKARYAMEVQAKDNHVTLGGEVTSAYEMHPDELKRHVRDAICGIGYTPEYAARWGKGNCIDPDALDIVAHIGQQSPQIAQGVDDGGWGDQGIFWGMATGTGATGYMPLDHTIAKRLGMALYEEALKGELPIGLDIKTQVTVADGRVTEVVVAAPCKAEAEQKALRANIIAWLADEYGDVFAVAADRIVVNGTGAYVRHSSAGDCGTTGRKLAVDFYGGNARIGGGCVDGETEYLAPDGWHKIKDYCGGPVGQVDEDFNLSFVTPKDYIKTWHDEVYEIATQKTLSMVLSGNHNIYYKTSKGNFVKKSASELVAASEKTAKGHHAEIPRFFYFGFSDGIKRPNAALNRLKVAHCADGTVLRGGTQTARFNGRIRVKKQRKAEALRNIFAEAGVTWIERDYKDGYATFCYHLDNTSKLLCEQFVNPDRTTAELLASEVLKWDGSERYQEYRTTKKRDADFMQFIMSGVSGDSYSICINKAHSFGKSDCYIVRKTKVKYTSPFRKGGMASVDRREPQMMYCFTVDTGLLLLRRRNYIFVTGNSPWGKDPSKADVTLNVYARHLALEMQSKVGGTVYCAIHCCIGRREIGIAYYDAHMNEITRTSLDLPASGIVDMLDLRRPVWAYKCAHGLFAVPDVAIQ